MYVYRTLTNGDLHLCTRPAQLNMIYIYSYTVLLSYAQEAVASSKETGRDLEHCKTLMRRFSDFEKVHSQQCV